jgi:hypothetical protein
MIKAMKRSPFCAHVCWGKDCFFEHIFFLKKKTIKKETVCDPMAAAEI